MNVLGTAIMWQTVAAIVAALLAVISGIAVVKAAMEQNAQADDIKGWLTGGDSFAHLYPHTQTNEKGEGVAVSYHVKHHGPKYLCTTLRYEFRT